MAENDEDPALVQFPFSRSGLSKSQQASKNLGLTELSKAANSTGKGAKGHWCKNCKGIWYSYFFEAECPVCGSRG